MTAPTRPAIGDVIKIADVNDQLPIGTVVHFTDQVDALFRSAGLTFLDDRLQRVADAAAAVRLAQENLVAAQVQLDSIR